MYSKKILLVLLFLFYFIQQSNAQTFGNEWINYAQTYFKFAVARDDIYRIPIAQLTALGLPSSVNGSNLQIFRDGNEVPIYVSNSGNLNATDYIEFFGEKGNGAVDVPLYKVASSQLNPNQNLLSDSAYYFITFNSSTSNKRITLRTNDLSSPPVKESFFWDKVKANYRGDFAAGPSYYYSTTPIIYLCSSQYEDGEGFTKKYTTNNDSITYTCLFPYKISGAPNAFFKTTVAGYSYISEHRMQLFANNNLIGDSVYTPFGYKRFNASIPMSYLSTNNKLVIKYTPLNTNVSTSTYDRYGISYTELRYPRQFNFNNVDSMYFELDPKLSNYYIEISNFKNNGVAPRLYDLTANEYIDGDISVSGLVRYVIPPSNPSGQIKRFFIQSQASTATYGTVANLKPVTFINYTQNSKQGDYIIISHSRLFDDGTGTNYVNEYKNYRASLPGGSFNPIIADVEDIYNEFGYGYTYHPQSIKNFLHYAYNNTNWLAKPKYVFIIGKGIDYANYLTYTAGSSSTYPYPIIPSFGSPSSDALLTDFNFTSKSQIPVGRIPAWNGTDVKHYLEKIIDHEASIQSTSHQISDSIFWQKNVLHIAGAKLLTDQIPIVSAMQKHENKIKDSLYGAVVTTIKKSTTSAIEQANSEVIDKYFKEGLNIVQFFGHASSSALDYNLDNPEALPNYKRYPVFIANGCSVGNVFITSVGAKSLGERFVFAPNAGSIAFVACDNTGLLNKLDTYTDSLYSQISTHSYGKTLGIQIKNSIAGLNLTSDPLLRQHAEQIILNGDPATSLHFFSKPDYAVEEKGVTFKQLNITTNLDSFDVKIILYNLGQFKKDSVSVFIKRTLPNGIEDIILHKNYAGIASSDTLDLRIPVLGNVAIGDNSIDILIDQEGFIDEVSETNNSIKRVFAVYNDDLVPVYPYEFGIVNVQGVTLKGSTLNPFADTRTYLMQIDTTEKFNSPAFRSTSITEKGGVIKWQPPITLKDSTVYYWRTAMDSSATNPTRKWSYSSFIYLDGSLAGWNQSHYFQFQKDAYTDIILDSVSRSFSFVGVNKKLQVQNVCLNSPPPYRYEWPMYKVKMNGSKLYDDGCDPYPGYSSLQFIVIDTLTGQPWINTNVGTEGRFGSYQPCRIGTIPYSTDPFFEFSFLNASSRKKIMDFIDSIPNGFYFMMQPRLCTGSGSGTCGLINSVFIKQWKADTTLYGSNNSLYHKLYNMGFTAIDSFYKNRPMVFFMKKNSLSSVQQAIEADSTKILNAEFPFTTYLYQGNIATNKIGPTKFWDKLIRTGFSNDIGPGDSTKVQVYGIDKSNSETLLATVQGDTSLSFINANTYPYIRLVMNCRDNNFTTPEQLRYWRVTYELVPEAALNPNRHFVYKDAVNQGEISRVEVAIENLTGVPMDSMLVRYSMIDRNKTKNTVSNARFGTIAAYDTIHAYMDINSKNFPGTNIFEIEANPDLDQVEQYHPNNIGFLNYTVAPDKQNPLIDVTFDGVHIMDKDIVSAKPFINITLRDENKFLALDDSSLVGVYMRYPGDIPTDEHYIPYDGNVLKFIPANLSDGKSKNVAHLEYRPTFTQDGNDYILSIKAKDKSGNFSGQNDYKVGFEIINKPAISSVINYPNPFTTSTQFIFTITGSEIPSNFKIQIISQSGKIVKEILKSDLGSLHVGTNITEYKWKGDDQFGQPLANGVYLYRVITNLHGKEMDHYQRSSSQNADKWIEKGFGKLYIMR